MPDHAPGEEYHGTPMAGPPPCKPPLLPKLGPHVRTVDPADPNFRRWFIPERRLTDCHGTQVVNQTVWGENEVTAYTYAVGLWNAMKQEIDKTSDSSHFIYIVGLDLGIDTDMTQGTGQATTLRALLTSTQPSRDRPGKAVQIRALLQPFGGNLEAVEFINSLANGAAVLDSRLPGGGTHHQKILVVNGAQGLVAFCGGTDIQPLRLTWHDVHFRIRGPAAQDLHRNFVERWRDHPGVAQLPAGRPKGVVSPQAVTTLTAKQRQAMGRSLADKHVQVVRTFGKLGGAGYCFAPNGEHSIYDLIAHAISVTEKFIYMEDQYLVAATPMKIGPPISRLLAMKLRQDSFKQLVILIPRTEGLNFFGEFGRPRQGWARRKNFISELTAAAPAKVAVCTYKVVDPKRVIDYVSPPFVHSKTWIFDDRFVITGSANCDRVGYTHHSEADVGVADPNNQGDRAFFAHDLRIWLWLKHLNPALEPGSSWLFYEKDVADPIQASIYWRCPHPQSQIEKYDVDGYKYLKAPNLAAKDDSDPNADQDWDAHDPDGS